jgi:hypothetical protein
MADRIGMLSIAEAPGAAQLRTALESTLISEATRLAEARSGAGASRGPSRIGKYEIIAPIGRGSMGEVFKARDTVIGRHVAVKTMSPAVGAIPELRQRFHREAQSAGSLSHPNIVTIFDFGEERGQAYLAMELLEGCDLKDLIGRQTPMTLAARLTLMEQICDGLAFAHARQVVHRDLKPANIHVLPDGHVKIVDFGLARLASSNMTQAGVLLGTPHYMSPEQVRGEKADARSDVFSLGVVFYELLANRKPFDADSMHSVLLRVLNDEPPPLCDVVPGIPPQLARILDLALAKDPARRFRDAGELREAVRAVRGALAGAEAEPEPAPVALVEPVTLRVAAADVRAAGGVLGRFRNARAARIWGRGRREPALAGAALVTLAALIAAVPIARLGGAAVRLAASPSAIATAAPARLLGAITSGLPPAAPGANPAAPDRALESAPVVGRIQAALDAGDVGTASREMDALLALDPGQPSLPALAARLEGLLMARLEQANDDLARVHEARAREARAREKVAEAAPKPARPQRLRPAPVPAQAEPSTVAAPAEEILFPSAPRRFDPREEEPLVRQAVKDLEQALKERDVRRLRGLTTDLSPADERAIEASTWRGLNVAITGVDVQDGRATVRVLWSLRTKEGTVSTVRRTLELARSVSGWKIATVGR